MVERRQNEILVFNLLKNWQEGKKICLQSTVFDMYKYHIKGGCLRRIKAFMVKNGENYILKWKSSEQWDPLTTVFIFSGYMENSHHLIYLTLQWIHVVVAGGWMKELTGFFPLVRKWVRNCSHCLTI